MVRKIHWCGIYFIKVKFELCWSYLIHVLVVLLDVAFLLAKSGKYGSKLEEGAKSITNHPLPKCMSRSTKNRRFCYTIMFTLLLMLAFIVYIIYAQVSDNFWRTTTFRVEFDERTGLEAYTGCYELDTTQGSSSLLEKKRKVKSQSCYNEFFLFWLMIIWKLTPFVYFNFVDLHTR